MDKGLYLNAIAKEVLPIFIYRHLAKQFIVYHDNSNRPVYDANKAYEILSGVERLKVFDDNYDDLHELVENGRTREAIRIARRKQQTT